MARILVVEDDFQDYFLLYSLLNGEGHKTYHASDGEEALKMYQEQDIDLVLTDLQMPNLDGLELIETLLDMNPDVAIIAVSGKGPQGLEEAKTLGARAVVSKPVDRDELLAAVASAARA